MLSGMNLSSGRLAEQKQKTTCLRIFLPKTEKQLKKYYTPQSDVTKN